MLLFAICFVACFALVWFAGALLYETGNLWLAVVLGVALILTLLIYILVKLRTIEKKLDKQAEEKDFSAQ
ncbi:MAG: hypothetical protein E7443_06175 [Ruminococcaceae bacterium]|nr:hypothetical protein [Oscillospiraceae bacterium]